MNSDSTIHTLRLSPAARAAAIAAFLIAGVASIFCSLSTFMFCGDEGYQTLCVRFYQDCPMAMLTFWQGHLWTSLFGDSVMALRSLMGVCYIVSVAIACWVMYRFTRAGVLSAAVFFAMCAACPFSTLFIYGWDSGAYPWMTLFAASLLWYLHRPSLQRIAVVGAAAALMALSRIPTLAALPVVLVFIIIKHRAWKPVLTHSVVGLTAFAAVGFMAILLITCGHPSQYVDAWIPDNIINGHFDTGRLIFRIKETTQFVSCAYAPALLCLGCAAFYNKVRCHRKLWFFISAAVAAVPSVMLLKTFMMYSIYAAGMMQGILAVLLLLPALYNATHAEKLDIPALPLWAIAACSVVAAVGSDGYSERFMTVSLIPMACAYVCPLLPRMSRSFLAMAVITIGLLFGLYTAVMNAGEAVDFSSKPRMAGIRTHKAEHDVNVDFSEISSVIESVESKGEAVAVVGYNRFPFDYVYHTGPSYNLQDFHYQDLGKGPEYIRQLMPRYNHILTTHYRVDNRDYSVTERLLLDNGYRVVSTSPYCTLFSRDR